MQYIKTGETMAKKMIITASIVMGVTISLLSGACNSSEPTSGASYSKDIQPIFNLYCVVCHQSADPSEGLNLEAGASYNNLVNVDSVQSDIVRVSPENTNQSYLWHKINGTQASVSGSGLRMPYQLPPLPTEKLDLIKKWIDSGAANN